MPVLFYFKDPATTEIYTLSLHDALPISVRGEWEGVGRADVERGGRLGAHRAPVARDLVPLGSTGRERAPGARDRKSTRLNSSHSQISYAVFCLKKKTNR